MERREFRRLPAETDVQLRQVRDEVSDGAQGKGKNISGGGILLASAERYEVGTLLDIEVNTTTHRSFTHAFRPLKARIRVLRVMGDRAPFDIAAEFIEVER